MARMTGQLGMQVTNHKKRETGDVVVRYKTFDQLELIYRRLRGDYLSNLTGVCAGNTPGSDEICVCVYIDTSLFLVRFRVL
jgi:hypothetical protein